MHVIDKQKEGTYSLPCKNVKIDNLGVLGSKLAQKIIKKLAEKPSYPKELAVALKEHEQKIYYHINKLKKAGFIRLLRSENISGAVANIYTISEDAFSFRFKELELTKKIVSKEETNSYLQPFIKDGKLDALIVVGSPDPHGLSNARSRDGYYGMDLALFLGTHLSYVPRLTVKLDTEIRDEDIKENNLIIFGGPVTNKVMEKVNDTLPVRFENGNIKSIISNVIYPEDENGFIVKAKNPFNKNKMILAMAGKRFYGTRACIIGFLRHFNAIVSGNKFNPKINAKVVRGLDLDSDGLVDDIEVLE